MLTSWSCSSFFSPHWNPVWVCVLVCTTGRGSLGSGSASVMDGLCGRACASRFQSLWFSFPTCTGENYRQQRSDEVCTGLRKDMVTGSVWGPTLRPEVHFYREQGPQGLCTGCSLCHKVFPPRCLRGSVPLYLLVVPEKGFHGEAFLAPLCTLLYVLCSVTSVGSDSL